jgi:SOS-response transcriptional repressor LexA
MPAITINSDSLISGLNLREGENLSTRLSHAIRVLNISQSELARRIGIKPQAIQYLCTSNATRSKFVFDIADALGINVDWLLAGQGKMLEGTIPTEDITTKAPLIEWSQITDWLEGGDQTIKPISYINTQLDFNKKCYALKIMDCSMAPRFEIGTLLIIDPESTPRENDFVIVATKFSENPIIRQLIKKNESLTLMPSNTTLYKEIPLNQDDKILGVLRQTVYEFVRR